MYINFCHFILILQDQAGLEWNIVLAFLDIIIVFVNFVFPFYGFVGIQQETFRIGAGSMKWVVSDKTCDHGRILMPL
jgi:hypothetical protein